MRVGLHVWYDSGMKKTFVAGVIVFLTPVAAFAAGFDRDLYFGMRSDADVTRLQEFLKAQTLYQGPITGNFFALTRAAVAGFQRREGIIPPVGYFGAKTRARAQAILAGTPVPAPIAAAANTAEDLLAKIQSIQAQIKALQAQQEQTASSSVTASATTTTPPAPKLSFTKSPYLAEAGFVSDFPLGARYPYRIRLDWATDASGVIDESVTCAPSLKVGAPSGRATLYYPEPRADYLCSVTVKDQAGGQVSGEVKFRTPPWVSVYGKADIIFPEIEISPFKIGEFRVFNGTSTDALFANFELLLTDKMDSIPNRGKKISFLLRDGSANTDPLISKTDFTIFSTIPRVEESHKIPLNFPFAVSLKPGEEKLVSVWVENMSFVKSGTLSLKTTAIATTDSGDQPRGFFEFNLTRDPSAL